MKPEEENMLKFFGAVLAILFSMMGTAFAQSVDDTDCDCTVAMGPPIVFTEDPLILADEGVSFHAVVEEVYFDAGDCVVFINFPDGATSTYQEATGHEVHRLKLAPHVAEHPAFAEYGAELTLSEVASGAADVCSPTNEPSS